MRSLVALAFLTAGCSLDFSEPPQPARESAAERDFESLALPILRAKCAVCHAGTAAAAPAFLAGDTPAEIRETLLTWEPPVVDLGLSWWSRLEVKGLHEGPFFAGQEGADLLSWIEAEREEAGVPPPPTHVSTGSTMPALCTSGSPGDGTCLINLFWLTTVGAPGAQLLFTADPLGTGVQISNLTFNVGGPGPFTLKHPIFVAHLLDGSTYADPTDQLADVVLSATGTIGSGTVTLDGVFAENPFAIEFDH